MKTYLYLAIGYTVVAYIRSNKNWASHKFWLLHPFATQAQHDNATQQPSATVGLRYDKDGLVLFGEVSATANVDPAVGEMIRANAAASARSNQILGV